MSLKLTFLAFKKSCTSCPNWGGPGVGNLQQLFFLNPSLSLSPEHQEMLTSVADEMCLVCVLRFLNGSALKVAFYKWVGRFDSERSTKVCAAHL